MHHVKLLAYFQLNCHKYNAAIIIRHHLYDYMIKLTEWADYIIFVSHWFCHNSEYKCDTFSAKLSIIRKWNEWGILYLSRCSVH